MSESVLFFDKCPLAGVAFVRNFTFYVKFDLDWTHFGLDMVMLTSEITRTRRLASHSC